MKLMETKQPAVTRRFFKIMMPGFHQKLKLPPAICKELEKCKSERAILESSLGKWKMGIKRNCKNGVLCLEQGWVEFVRGHGLSIADFVVFEPTNTQHHLHFKVFVFDSSACEKEFGIEKKATEALNPTAEDGSPYFRKTMIPSYATKAGRVTIPTDFMKSNTNLGKQASAALRDPRGRAWVVKLETVNRAGFRQRMSSGWHDFYASNALNVGDECIFKLIRPKNDTTRAIAAIFFDVHIHRRNNRPT